ncbi:hypothetical protein FV242_30770 [Methylobacterium sp. WL64]|uniref:hypothetical protein n=1 Tax=Methylobacterium sp. WL64 TaxID=2603894 RepID=UPI0011C971F8|nr:hypothetical protein [Methylobacterium sp. WL64]TXM97739.1 hypothetical protein FV242_30770 [Methylobacterium sp. WL64]
MIRRPSFLIVPTCSTPPLLSISAAAPSTRSASSNIINAPTPPCRSRDEKIAAGAHRRVITMKKPKNKTTKPKRPQSEWRVEPVEGTSGMGPYPPDSSDLQRRIKANPLGVCAEARHQLGEVQAGYRRELYGVLALIVGIARHYYSDYKAWKVFFKQPCFHTSKVERKARTHQVHALRHTMNYVFDAKSKQGRSRTGKYAAALHEYMLVGIPVDQIAAQIEQDGGIEKLYEKYLEREARKPKKGRHQAINEAEYAATMQYGDLGKKTSGTPEDMTAGDLEDGPPSAEGDSDQEDWDDREDGEERIEGLDIYDDAGFELRPTLKRGRDPSGRDVIMLEVTPEMKKRLLSVKAGQLVMVRLIGMGVEEGDDPDKDWVRLRARRAFRWPIARAKVPVH